MLVDDAVLKDMQMTLEKLNVLHKINQGLIRIESDINSVRGNVLVDIPVDARIPVIPLHVVKHFLSIKMTACGPDELPYWLFRDFARDLAPAVNDVFNSSLQRHNVPSPWNMADINLLPKESPLTSCAQLRLISLTAVIMRLLNVWLIGLNFPVLAKIISI